MPLPDILTADEAKELVNQGKAKFSHFGGHNSRLVVEGEETGYIQAKDHYVKGAQAYQEVMAKTHIAASH